MTKCGCPSCAAMLLLFAVLVGGALPAKPALAQPTGGKPNILFILVDNLGYGELGIYGGGATRGAPTPRIDQLARRVVVDWPRGPRPTCALHVAACKQPLMAWRHP